LHQPGNAEQLAQQVLELEADIDRGRQMGEQGRAWLEQNADEGQWRKSFVKIAAHAVDAVC
jgi:hypothetical protein